MPAIAARYSYEAEIDPGGVGICHCTDCQTLTGTAFRITVGAQEADLRFTSGTPKIYVKTGSSGAKRAQGFCADCGSPLFATSVGDGPKVYGLRVGTIRQRDRAKTVAAGLAALGAALGASL